LEPAPARPDKYAESPPTGGQSAPGEHEAADDRRVVEREEGGDARGEDRLDRAVAGDGGGKGRGARERERRARKVDGRGRGGGAREGELEPAVGPAGGAGLALGSVGALAGRRRAGGAAAAGAAAGAHLSAQESSASPWRVGASTRGPRKPISQIGDRAMAESAKCSEWTMARRSRAAVRLALPSRRRSPIWILSLLNL
jgi:hypothetical protein